MQPQPRPDAPAPLPSEAAIRSQNKWRWMWRVSVGSICLILLWVLSSPIILRSHRTSDPPAAASNARVIGVSLSEFQIAYGKFPSADTIAEVRRRTGSDLDLGTVSSNDFFRQLIASGIAGEELIFYAKGAAIHKPDGVFSKGEALKKGECGFTYLLGALESDHLSRPLVIAPMIPDTDRFDPRPFGGKAVIFKLDHSVTCLPIDKDGHVFIYGKNMMDPHHPIWDGHAPVIAWPDL